MRNGFPQFLPPTALLCSAVLAQAQNGRDGKPDHTGSWKPIRREIPQEIL